MKRPPEHHENGIENRGPISFESLRTEWLNQAHLPPGNDQVISALSQALYEYPENSTLMSAVKIGIDFRLKAGKLPSESEIAGTVRSAICTYLMHCKKPSSARENGYFVLPLDPDFSFDSLDQPKHWISHLDTISDALTTHSQTDIGVSNFELNMLSRNVQTTLPQRYAPQELIQQLLARRFSQGASQLDIGSGIMEGPQQQMLKDRFPMSFEAVFRSISEARKGTASQELLDKVNWLLKQPSVLKDIVCVDTQRIYNDKYQRYNEGIIEWSRGSLRPSETTDNDFMAKFNGLIEEKSPHITFHLGDLSKKTEFEAFMSRFGDKKYEYISVITAWHQLPAMQRIPMFQAIQQLLAEDGLVTIQDFGRVHGQVKRPQAVQSIQMYRHWHQPYRYRTFIYDSAQPKPGFQEAFSYSDSRCNVMALNAAKLLINDELYPVEDLIKNS